jgi:hypothetical protein
VSNALLMSGMFVPNATCAAALETGLGAFSCFSNGP